MYRLQMVVRICAYAVLCPSTTCWWHSQISCLMTLCSNSTMICAINAIEQSGAISAIAVWFRSTTGLSIQSLLCCNGTCQSQILQYSMQEVNSLSLSHLTMNSTPMLVPQLLLTSRQKLGCRALQNASMIMQRITSSPS